MELRVLYFFSLLAFSHAGILPFFNSRIVNGEDVKEGEIPYQVSLQDKNIFDRHFCGGSILNKNYVITAAHCVNTKLAEDIKVVAGTIDLNDPKSLHDVEEIIVHENFNASWVNDIALLKVKPPINESTTIGYVSLPSTDIAIDEVAVVSGWGDLWPGGPNTNKLQRVNIRIVDQTYCIKKYEHFACGVWSKEQVCAYNSSIKRGFCKNDDGGPLTVNKKLVGLASWGVNCADKSYPGIFTRVFFYLDWIKDNTNI